MYRVLNNRYRAVFMHVYALMLVHGVVPGQAYEIARRAVLIAALRRIDGCYRPVTPPVWIDFPATDEEEKRQ